MSKNMNLILILTLIFPSLLLAQNTSSSAILKIHSQMGPDSLYPRIQRRCFSPQVQNTLLDLIDDHQFIKLKALKQKQRAKDILTQCSNCDPSLKEWVKDNGHHLVEAGVILPILSSIAFKAGALLMAGGAVVSAPALIVLGVGFGGYAYYSSQYDYSLIQSKMDQYNKKRAKFHYKEITENEDLKNNFIRKWAEISNDEGLLEYIEWRHETLKSLSQKNPYDKLILNVDLTRFDFSKGYEKIEEHKNRVIQALKELNIQQSNKEIPKLFEEVLWDTFTQSQEYQVIEKDQSMNQLLKQRRLNVLEDKYKKQINIHLLRIENWKNENLTIQELINRLEFLSHYDAAIAKYQLHNALRAFIWNDIKEILQSCEKL